jgi:hypothetical protein
VRGTTQFDPIWKIVNWKGKGSSLASNGANEECLSFLDLSGGPASNAPEITPATYERVNQSRIKYRFVPQKQL